MAERSISWSTAASSSKPLDAEDLRRAAEAIANQPYEPDPCKLGKHVVSPKALTRPGWYRCGNCGCAVEIPYPLIER